MWLLILATQILSMTCYWPLVIVSFIILGIIMFKYFQLYRTFDIDTITTISKNISISTVRDERNEPCCLFIGKYYIGYIYKSSNNKENNILYCLCTENKFEELKKKKGEIEIDTDKYIPLYTRRGNNFNFRYGKRKLNCTKFLATDSQKKIINEVSTFYQNNNNCVIMISGRPGTGKSSMGILIAKELNGSLCKTYDPTNPGDYLENVYNQVNPINKNPLILLIDEFDILLHSLHNKLVVLHDNIPTEVSNKTKWNNLFDDFNLKLYPNLIVILTTNLTRKTIEQKYDSSYIRPGRVNFHYNISENEISGCFTWLKT